MSLLASYTAFVVGMRAVLFYIGVLVAAVCVVDWAVRTRRINAFSRVARFFRGNVEPLMTPIDRAILRGGGMPTSTPWWTIAAYALFGILVITALRFIGGILTTIIFAAADPKPGAIILVLVSWTLSVLQLALLVRVISSWLPVSPGSPWIRWSYTLTEWMLAPLRSVVPRLGMLDITPMIAWLLLSLIQSLL